MNRTHAALAVIAALLAAAVSAGTAAADDTYIGSRVTMQQVVGGRHPDGGAGPINLNASGYALTSTTLVGCASITIKAHSCGTTPTAVPVSRVGGSMSLEVTNSPENAGSPKVKCMVDPSDGGVGFGTTNPGLVRLPGETLTLALDSTHTVICVCDTPATGLTTAECVPGAP